jgi:RHS repeat-associated protein
VAASDPDHENPFLFTGRRYDTETGLYYYRARYYNPTTGRFLQTDPIGYGDGMNMYAYCKNGPVSMADPSGLGRFLSFWEEGYVEGMLAWAEYVDGRLDSVTLFSSIDE